MDKEKFKEIYICDLILNEIYSEANKRSIAWLASEINHEESSLNKLLSKNNSIQTKLLFDISIATKVDFFYCFSKILDKFSVEIPNDIIMNDQTQICELIHKILKKKRRSVAWLASKVYNNNRNSLNILLKPNRNSIDTDVLLNISIALEFDFFFCFSKILSKYSPRKI